MEINLAPKKESKYLNSTKCKTGDTITFLNEGELSEIMDKRSGKPKQIMNFMVEVRAINKPNEVIAYSPSERTLQMIVEKWGKESKAWVGKSFTAKIITMNIRGDEVDTIRPVFE